MKMTVIKREKDYFVEWTVDGRRFSERIGKSKALAMKLLNKIKFEIAESNKCMTQNKTA